MRSRPRRAALPSTAGCALAARHLPPPGPPLRQAHLSRFGPVFGLRWPWSSLGRRSGRPGGGGGRVLLPPAAWPVAWGGDWAGFVNAAQTAGELADVRASLDKGRPFGDPDWRRATIGRLGLASGDRKTGRPRKE